MRSALEQDYEGSIEVIVVFDASDPFEFDVPEAPNRSIRTTRNNRTRGLAGGRNTGILAAEGEYVAFLDDDDWWQSDKIRRQIELIDRDPAMPLVGAGMTVVTPQGDTPRPISRNPVTLVDLVRDRIPELNACGIMVRRSDALGDLGLVDEALPGSYGEDYDLLLRAARLHPIAVVDDPVVMVQWNGTSLFGRKWRMIADALEYLLDKHPEIVDDRKGFARIAGQIAFARAALDERRAARSWARKALRADAGQARAYLALAVSYHVVTPERVLSALNRRGRGI